MKQMAAYIMMVLLLAMNVAEAAHAACLDAPCDEQASIMAGDHEDEHPQADCDSCLCGHHCHAHIFLPPAKAEDHADSTHAIHLMDADSRISHLHYPPSRPPKA